MELPATINGQAVTLTLDAAAEAKLRELLAPGAGSRLWTRREVARHFGIGLRTVDNWVDRGWVPVERKGRVVRFDPVKLMAAESRLKRTY